MEIDCTKIDCGPEFVRACYEFAFEALLAFPTFDIITLRGIMGRHELPNTLRSALTSLHCHEYAKMPPPVLEGLKEILAQLREVLIDAARV